MKIIMTRNEDIALDILMHDVGPEVPKHVGKWLTENPLLELELSKDGDACYTVNEEYILKAMSVLTDDVKVVVPLCKSLFHLLSTTCTKLGNITRFMVRKTKERRAEVAKAEQDMTTARDMMEEAAKILNKDKE